MVRMTAVILRLIQKIAPAMTMIAAMKAASQTIIPVKKLGLISTTKQMLTTITISNIKLKQIIQISNYMPRVHITIKTSRFLKTHKAQLTPRINKLNTKAKTMLVSSMFSTGMLSKFITSINSTDSNLSHIMHTWTTSSSNRNSISGTKSDKVATMSLRFRAKNEYPM